MITGTSFATTIGRTGLAFYFLTDDGRVATVSENAITTISPPVALTGLLVNDVMMSIDVRPMNQGLYGWARNASTATLQLYHITPATGVAAPVGPPATVAGSAGATKFGMDFNPMVDRLRVISDNGLNLRINPNTGAVIFDTQISGVSTSFPEVAYTENIPDTPATSLYLLDPVTDALYTASSPNTGSYVFVRPITLSGVTLNFSAVGGFDFAPGTSTGYAILTTGGVTGFYRINLASGAATLLGNTISNIKGMTVRSQYPIAFALQAAGTNLVRFQTTAPSTILSSPIAGITSGETLVGISFRPATGQLCGLGINAIANTGTLYVVDPFTAALTTVGTAGQINFVIPGGATPVDFSDVSLVAYGFDFNPTVDRARVVTGSGLNFRINPLNGAPVDGDTVSAGINTDANLNGQGLTAMATAYTDSFAGSTTTTMYTLDSSTKALRIQSPPNNGTLIGSVPVTLNGSSLNFSSPVGFDIFPDQGGHPAVFDAAASYGLAAFNVAGTAGLYWLNLTTGAATLQGVIGNGTPVRSLAVTVPTGVGFAPVSWPSVSGSVYRIETSTNLVNWFSLPGTVTANQTTTTAPVGWYSGENRRFWRAVTP